MRAEPCDVRLVERRERVHVDEERVVATDAIELDQRRVIANCGNTLAQFPLLVNREQDLNDPGLHKAKLSYHPVEFLQKYRVTLT